MLTVHKMPLKNQFVSGISFVYDKTPNQNEIQPFTSLSFNGDCTFDFFGKESCRRVTDTFTGTGIVYNSMTKPDAEMMPFNGDFEYFGFNFEIETAKNNKFLVLCANWRTSLIGTC